MVYWLGFFSGVTRKLALAALLLFSVTAASQVFADSANEREVTWQQINQQLRSLGETTSAAARAGERIDPAEISKGRQAIVQRAINLYRQQPADSVSFNAMLLTIFESNGRDTYIEICQNLIDHHIDHPSLHQFFPMMFSLARFESNCETLLLKAAEQGASSAVRDAAKLHLAAIYRMMSELLANLDEMGMTMQQYTTSKRRSSFAGVSTEEMSSISKHLCESGWQSRNWRQVKKQALEIVTPLLNSKETVSHYMPGYLSKKNLPLINIANKATAIHYQLLNSIPGAPLAEFDFRDFNGEPVQLKDHRGKVVLIDVWATWCQPCVTGLKDMRALQQSMSGKPFSLITVNIDRKLEDAQKFAASNPMPFHNWYVGNDREFFDQWSVYHIPKVIIVDTQGVVRAAPNVGHEDLLKYVSGLVSAAEE